MIKLERFRRVLTDKNPSQYKLAQMIGVNRGDISKWANDENNPSLENFTKVAIAKNLSADYLLGLKEDEKPYEYSLYVDTDNQTLNFSVFEVTNRELQHIPLALQAIRNMLNGEGPYLVNTKELNEEQREKLESALLKCKEEICAIYSKL